MSGLVNVVRRVGRCATFRLSLSNAANESSFRTYSRDDNVDRHQNVVGKRFSSSGGGGGRVSGRRRFYKEVNVKPAAVAPWEKMSGVIGGETNAVDSPISAGVDDTQSASGVSLSTLDPSQMRRLMSVSGVDGGGDDDVADWYVVTLDGRTLRTPLGITLSVPSLPLALGIAAEWDAQKKTLSPTQMPLTTLACTVIDQADPDVTATIDRHCLPYLFNDTTCYLADPADDRVLYRKQNRYYPVLHEFVAEHLQRYDDVDVDAATDDAYRPVLALGAHESILLKGLPHPSPLVRAVTNYVRTLNAWELTCLQSLTREAKSLLVGLGTLLWTTQSGEGTTKTCFPNGIDDIVMTSRIEEEFQIENWGLVEGGHDYDRLNCRIAVTAAVFMLESIRA